LKKAPKIIYRESTKSFLKDFEAYEEESQKEIENLEWNGKTKVDFMVK